MKKSRRKPRGGNPAKKRLKADVGADHRGWLRWIGREADAFFGLPEWLVWLILLLLGGAVIGAWRMISG